MTTEVTPRVLVVGAGSAGQRHLRNLRSLGLSAIGVCRRAAEPVAGFPEVPVYRDLASALDSASELVLIATPTSEHLVQALEVARRGRHLLIEKPVSHTLQGLDQLTRLVSDQKLVAAVGYNLRFHPGLRALREVVRAGTIGRPVTAQATVGQFLPDWRPAADYRASYSAHAALGGGVLLDLSHELDYLQWLFGPARRVTAVTARLGALEMDVEDTAAIIAEFESGLLAEVHLDCLRRTVRRDCEVVGEAGTLRLDFVGQRLVLEDARGKRSECWAPEPGWDAGAAYVDELRDCVAAIREGRAPAVPLEEGVLALRFALAARRSAQTGLAEKP